MNLKLFIILAVAGALFLLSLVGAIAGLFLPPLHLPRSVGRSYQFLRRRWEAAGAAPATLPIWLTMASTSRSAKALATDRCPGPRRSTGKI